MASDPKQLTCRCGECGNTFPVPAGKEGEAGKCPVCDAKLTYPQSPNAKIFFRCEHCKVGLNATLSKAGTKITCPKCKKSTVIRPQQKSDGLVQEEVAPTFSAENIDRQAKLAWAELEESKRDSYYMALLRAFTYPIQAMGVIIFFTVGIPLLATIMGLVSEYVVNNFGNAQGDGSSYVASVTVVVGIFAFAAVTGILASLLFSITHVSAVGSNMVPVIQGLHHRENLASFAGWAFMYIGPGLFFGFDSSQQALWTPTGGAIFFLLILLPIAPMAFLMTATLGGNQPYNFGDLFKSLTRNFGDYCYLLLMVALSTALFFWLGSWVSGIADAKLAAPATSTKVIGIILKILGGCFYFFPIVTLARMTGLFGQYHTEKLAFDVEGEPYSRAATMSRLIMYAGLIILFFPLNSHMQKVSEQGGIANRCADNLRTVAERCSGMSNNVRLPKDEKEFIEKFSGNAVCPYCEFLRKQGVMAKSDKKAEKKTSAENDIMPTVEGVVADSGPAKTERFSDYEVFGGIDYETPNDMIAIWDKKPHPDGYRSILTFGKKAQLVSAKNFDTLMKLQKEIIEYVEKHPNFKNNPDEKDTVDKLAKQMQTARVMSM